MAGTTGSVLVIGGGIAGIQSALDLANSGFKVYILEKAPTIGGYMALLDKTLPTNDCSMCILSPKMVEAGTHPNIEIIAYSELKEVAGEAGNFKLKISKKPRYIKEDLCTGCALCLDACVQKGRVEDEWSSGLGKRGAVHIPFPQAVPKLAVVDPNSCLQLTKGKCKMKCAEACPQNCFDFEQKEEMVEIEAGAIIDSSGIRSYDENKLLSLMPKSESILTAMQMERLQCASGPTGGEILKSDGSHPERIAWVQCAGSRSKDHLPYCSGVCCAYAVKQAMIVKDHDPTIDCHIYFHDQRSFGKGYEAFFRRAESIYGIKFHHFRQPLIKTDKSGKVVLSEFRENEGLVKEHFDMAVLSTGFVPSETETKELLGIETDDFGFVKTKAFNPQLTNREGVFVCGTSGGPRDIPESVSYASAAAAKAETMLADSRGTLIRKKDYPEEKASDGEVRIGCFVCHCGTNIAATVDVEAVKEMAEGLPGVVYADTNMYTCSADGCESIREAVKKHDLNRVIVAACTPRTHEPLFREVCREAGLNKYLFELANIRDHCSWVHKNRDEATDKAKSLVRMSVSRAALMEPLETHSIPVEHSALVIGGGISGLTTALELSSQGFQVYLLEKKSELGGALKNVESSLSGENPSAVISDLINKVDSDEKIKVYLSSDLSDFSGYVGNFEATVSGASDGEKLKFGVVIVATGGDELKPESYSYGKDDRIMTQGDLEEVVRDKGDIKNRITMIQCVESRDEKRKYCSRICCERAIKNALAVKEYNPGAEITILYRDIMMPGMKETYYEKARKDGITFIRYEKDSIPETSVDGSIKVKLKAADLGKEMAFETDLLVLSTPIVPSESAKKVSELIKAPLDENGFFSEAHVKLRPVDFAGDGMYLCGTAHSPKPVAENIAQACAAASRASQILSHEMIEADGSVAEVDSEVCRGCGMCVSVCPYGAITMIEREIPVKIADINPALCKGCGTCNASCLSSAIDLRHFRNSQIEAMIESRFV